MCRCLLLGNPLESVQRAEVGHLLEGLANPSRMGALDAECSTNAAVASRRLLEILAQVCKIFEYSSRHSYEHSAEQQALH